MSRLPRWLSGKDSACQCRRHGFSPWVWKISWSKKWQPALVFLPGKSHGQRSLVGYSPWGRKRVRHDLATKQQQYSAVCICVAVCVSVCVYIYMCHIFIHSSGNVYFRLFPYLGYCGQCCYEHRGACIFLNYSFVQIHAQDWDCWIIW